MNFRFPIILKRLALVLALAPLAVCAQPSTTDPFEAKLADFKYSNYAYFARSPTVVFEKLQAFVTENRQEIQKYKIHRLEKNLQNPLDLSTYTEDTESNFSEMLPKLPSGDAVIPVVALSMIEPDKLLLSLSSSNYIMSLRKDEIPFSEIGLRNGLTAPKLRIIKIQEGLYQISSDFYTRIYVVDYHLDDNTFKNPKVFVKAGAADKALADATRSDQK